ncbi:MAG: CDP-alcohol phosphatidyltransferase family protein [Pseudomonadota bacterium]
MTSGDGPLRLIGETDVRIYGLPAAEWQGRNWRRAGVARAAGTILTRTDWVFSAGLTMALVGAPGVALVQRSGGHTRLIAAHLPEATKADQVEAMMSAGSVDEAALTALGLRVETPETLAGGYNETLRKRETPFALPIADGGVRDAEQALFKSAYKGATDLVTKYLWPVPALAVTRFCAARRISPNTVTSVSLVFVLMATWAFWRGDWVTGFVCGWLMTFLDTVDGKLARTTLTSSKWGHYFDHGIDWVHPPFWYIAWYLGIHATVAAPPGWMDTALGVILVGYVLGRTIENVFRYIHGFQIHVWQPFDYGLRIVTARRNPNTLIFMVFTLFGAPAVGLGAVAVWTVVCTLLHTVRLITAGFRRAEPPLKSWMAA